MNQNLTLIYKKLRRFSAPYFVRCVWLAEYFFPYMYVITWMFLFLDIYVYPGFVQKVIFLDARLFIVVAMALGLTATLGKAHWRKKNGPLMELVFGVNRLLLPVGVFLYVLVTFAEENNYPNFVFSRFHLHALYFKYLVVFLIITLLVDLSRIYHKWLLSVLIPQSRLKLFRSSFHYNLFLLTIVIAGYLVITNAFVVWQTMLQYYVFMVKKPFASYEEKSRYILGDYEYFTFIKDYTPESAVIAIPPQQIPWLTSGNGGYLRYFVYPRQVINSNLGPPLPEIADYAIIDKGEWYVDDESLYGWPKATVSAEKIWYFDRDTAQVTESNDITFDPTIEANRYKWGLIKLKK